MKTVHAIILKVIFLSVLGISFSPTYAQITFEKITLSDVFVGEGVSVGDFNKDGNLDVVAGPFLWIGPEFTERYRIGSNGKESYETTTYAYYYMQTRPYDVNNDGWLDVPFQKGLQEFAWLENPGGNDLNKPWKENSLGNGMGGESAQFYPLFSKDKNVLIANYNFNDTGDDHGPISWSEYDKAKKEWVWHIISEKKYKRNLHGLGIGDINGNGRQDIIAKDGWYEQPASLEHDPIWKYHEYWFSFNPYNSRQNLGGSHIFVDDLDGDGDGDVVAALEGHGWGLAWFEQIKQGDTIAFTPHMIMGKDDEKEMYKGVGFSQLHSLGYVDVDADGLKDIVTGKRHYAHNGRDPDGNGPAVLYWFKQIRNNKGTSFVPMLIDSTVGSGSSMEEQKDIDGDGHPDIVTSSKKGTYIFLTRGHEKTISTQEYQFTTLFQKNSLKGWKTYEANKLVDASDRWTIKDGVLHAVADGDSVGHWLVSDKTYGDFILRFEFQLLNGNSGINFHSFFDNEDVQGPQMDMANKSTGQIYDLVMNNGKYAGKYLNPQTALGREIYKQGEWNQVEIRTQGDNIKILLNDTAILEYVFESGKRKGFLAWQLHSGMKMDFSVRNLKISEWKKLTTKK